MTPEQLRQRRRERKIVWPVPEHELKVEFIFGSVELVNSWIDMNGYGWGMSIYRDQHGNITKVNKSKTGIRLIWE